MIVYCVFCLIASLAQIKFVYSNVWNVGDRFDELNHIGYMKLSPLNDFHRNDMAILKSKDNLETNQIFGNTNYLNTEFPVVKTGTTIVGFCCCEGVVLGADTRTTGGTMVINKNKHKIHKIANRIYCCTAGTVADCDFIVRQAKYDIQKQRIYELQSNRDERRPDNVQQVIKSITRSFNSKGRSPEAVFIIGGHDNSGFTLSTVDMNGIACQSLYCSLGSGSTKAYSILESEISRLGLNPDKFSDYFVDGISIKQAEEIVRKAVMSGIENDLGSGSHIDLVTITKDDVKAWREEINQYTGERMLDLNNIGLKESKSDLDECYPLGRQLKIADSASICTEVEMIFE